MLLCAATGAGALSYGASLDFFLRRSHTTPIAAHANKTDTTTPTLMPAMAPVDRAELLVRGGVVIEQLPGETQAVDVGTGAVWEAARSMATK